MAVIIKNVMKILVFFTIMAVRLSHAEEIIKESHDFAPTQSKHANWVFLGMVENESGDIYDYLFKIQRNGNNFRAIVALFDFQTKKIVFQEDSRAKIADPLNFNWEIGRAFLNFNQITDNWVFGLKDQNKTGFNFKVGMLNKPEDQPVTQYFRDGISFVVAQAGQLNGNINLKSGGGDQFVTAKNTWFRQIWLNSPSKQQLNSLLCSFNDGRGMYSMRVIESSKFQDTAAGLFDSEGRSNAISQFIKVEKNENDSWKIKVITPAMDLILTDTYKQNDIIAGFLLNNSSLGFCMLSQDEIESSVELRASLP